jgi:hypothetical protein
MINFEHKVKYVYENPRNMPATGEYRTCATWCLFQAKIQPARIMGFVMQVAGKNEEGRQSPRKDRWSNTDGGRQEDQGTEVRWTIARLLGQQEKILIPNSEPIAPIASHDINKR